MGITPAATNMERRAERSAPHTWGLLLALSYHLPMKKISHTYVAITLRNAVRSILGMYQPHLRGDTLGKEKQ